MVLLALIVAVPFTMFDTAVMVRGLLSGSLSLASTAMLTAVPAAVVAVSATATGGVLPGVWPSKVAVTLMLRDALRVAQSACAGAEAEIGEVRAAEELRSDVAGERGSHRLAIEGVAQSLRCRIPGDNDGMPGAVLDIGRGPRAWWRRRRRCPRKLVWSAGDVGAGHAGLSSGVLS